VTRRKIIKTKNTIFFILIVLINSISAKLFLNDFYFIAISVFMLSIFFAVKMFENHSLLKDLKDYYNREELLAYLIDKRLNKKTRISRELAEFVQGKTEKDLDNIIIDMFKKNC